MILTDDSDVILTCLDQLSGKAQAVEPISSILDKLKVELDRDIARRIYASKNNGYKILLDVIKNNKTDLAVLKSALKTITSLMTGNPDLLDKDGVILQMEYVFFILIHFI